MSARSTVAGVVVVVENEEARGAASETCSHNCCSLLKWLVGFYRGCEAKVCFLFAATSVCTTFTYLMFRVLLIHVHLLFLLGRLSNFLISDGKQM